MHLNGVRKKLKASGLSIWEIVAFIEPGCLKMNLSSFGISKIKKSAKEFLDGWCKTAAKSRLESIKKFVNTIRKHEYRLLPFVDTRLTNAIAEGINRIIQMIKNRASGFRTLEAFEDLILLTIGDLDIPAQIPTRFHAL